ncbi:MAG: signal peptide peptidase SppA [Sedimentisphaerales bacterium]|nr:signal peptide peptidase SppA [Sedimentisphaerales bacterium]
MDPIENPYASDMPAKKSGKGLGWKIFFAIILAFSIIANMVLFFTLMISVIAFTASESGHRLEKTLREGSGKNKIAVIKIEGVINKELAESVTQQIEDAKNDKKVKAVIFHTNTPGGSVSASDRVYDQIIRFRAETGKPAVAFMESIATSGGMYTSAGCDKIIAEPTAITGSIGVIMGHFVFQELFEEKLGIRPSVVKSGEKKDWPTSFEPVTEEQRQYLSDKLIMPAYERFVNIVAESRKDLLEYEQVRALADGSIYNATEAMENKLIDEIGYMSEAVELAKSLANISDAKVVEYEKPFSLEDFLGAKTLLKLNRDTIVDLTTPQLMYLWDAGLQF